MSWSLCIFLSCGLNLSVNLARSSKGFIRGGLIAGPLKACGTQRFRDKLIFKIVALINGNSVVGMGSNCHIDELD